MKVGDRVKGRTSWGHPANRDLEGDVVLMIPAKKKLTNREMNIYAKLKDFAEPNYKSVQGPAGVARLVVKKDDGHFVVIPQEKVRLVSVPPVANARNQDLGGRRAEWVIHDEQLPYSLMGIDFAQSEARMAAEYAPRGWTLADTRPSTPLTIERLQEARSILDRNAIDVSRGLEYYSRQLANISATEALERNREAERRYQERRQIAQNQAERIGDAAWWADEDWS